MSERPEFPFLSVILGAVLVLGGLVLLLLGEKCWGER